MVTRIRQLLDTKQLTPTQFADFIGVGRPVMSHILSERNKPSLEVVQRIISAFPEISLPWLLSGLGEMLGEAAVAAPTTSPAAEENPVAAPAGPTTAAPTEEEPVAASEPIEPEPGQPQPASVADMPAVAMPIAPAPIAPAALPAPTQAFPVAAQAPLAALSAPSAGPQAFSTGSASVAAPALAPAPALPSAPVAMQPFRAARFVPAVAAGAPVTAPRKPAVASLPTPETPVATLASATVPALPAADTLAASLGAEPTASKQSPEAALLPFLGEPGKEIRRIVIFYRDGSFADYQPEA